MLRPITFATGMMDTDVANNCNVDCPFVAHSGAGVSDGAEVRIFDEVPRLIVVGGERWFAQPWRWW